MRVCIHICICIKKNYFLDKRAGPPAAELVKRRLVYYEWIRTERIIMSFRTRSLLAVIACVRRAHSLSYRTGGRRAQCSSSAELENYNGFLIIFSGPI